MHIIEKQEGVDMAHCKGYTIQKYLPVLDGMKAFTKEKRDKSTGKVTIPQGPFYKEWVHQRAYFMDILRGVANLLNAGIAMTDLKPGNTLYNAEIYSGTLIDLLGVVTKKSMELLKQAKVKDVTEFTKFYTAPEFLKLLENEQFDSPVDLCNALLTQWEKCSP